MSDDPHVMLLKQHMEDDRQRFDAVDRHLDRLSQKIENGFVEVRASLRTLHERDNQAERDGFTARTDQLRLWLYVAGAVIVILLGVVGFFYVNGGSGGTQGKTGAAAGHQEQQPAEYRDQSAKRLEPARAAVEEHRQAV